MDLDKGINVLSCFDGISAGQLALDRACIKVGKYYASEIDKYAMQVTQARYPDTIQLGDITKWNNWDIEQPDIITGGSPCFVGDTLVITKQGYKSIKEIVVGDYVLTHRLRYKQVLKTGNKNNFIYLLDFKGKLGVTKVTSNHPYYVRKSIRHEPEWRTIGKLDESYYIAIPMALISLDDSINEPNFIEYLDDNPMLGEICWVKIHSLIDPDTTVERVYNLEVEEDNSYTANLAIVHNCQGFSFAGKQLNFDDPRSKLFFEFVDIIKHYKPKYFLLENVIMKKEYQQVISECLGVEPMEINSSLLSAQNRRRLYWVGVLHEGIYHQLVIPQPKDKGILLKDVLETGVVDRNKSFCIDANYYKGGNVKNYFDKSRRQLVFNKKKITAITQGGNTLLFWCEKVIITTLVLDLKDTTITIDNDKLSFKANNKKVVEILFSDLDVTLIKSFSEARTDLGKESRKEIRQNTGKDSTLRNPEHKKYILNKHEKANRLVTVDSFLNYILCGNVKGAAIRGRYLDDEVIGQQLELRKDYKTNAITTVQKDNVVVREKSKCVRSGGRGSFDRHEWDSVDNFHVRKLTVIEVERLQTFPDNYTLVIEDNNKQLVSNSRRYHALGNSWTVDVIVHILQNLDSSKKLKPVVTKRLKPLF